MNKISVPLEAFTDARMCKNSMRLLAYAIHKHNIGEIPTVPQAIGELLMSHRTYYNSLNRLRQLGYFVDADAAPKKAQWRLSDAVLETTE